MKGNEEYRSEIRKMKWFNLESKKFHKYLGQDEELKGETGSHPDPTLDIRDMKYQSIVILHHI